MTINEQPLVPIDKVDMKVELQAGEVIVRELRYSRIPACWIELDVSEVQGSRFEGNDLFDCLEKLRLALEKHNIRLLCNGSRLDCYPSKLCRDMGKGLKLYRCRMGEQGKFEDMVLIFREADADKIGTVSSQKEYHEQWLKSLV